MLFLQFYVLLLVPAHLNCSWCRVPALGSVRAVGYEQHLLLLLLFLQLFFLLRAADAISCGGACSAICGCCFCNSMCCLSCSCAFKLQLVPVPALGFVRAWRHEQHLLFLLLVFLLRGCWCRFMWRCLLWQSGCCFCNSMCCLSCSCTLKLQLVPVPALGFGAGSGV